MAITLWNKAIKKLNLRCIFEREIKIFKSYIDRLILRKNELVKGLKRIQEATRQPEQEIKPKAPKLSASELLAKARESQAEKTLTEERKLTAKELLDRRQSNREKNLDREHGRIER